MVKKPESTGEFDLIRRLFRPLADNRAGALDLLDDGAVLDTPEGLQTVVTVDALVAGVHFLETLPPEDVAHKVVGVNLSDLAAMGAMPNAVFLTVQMPETLDEPWLTAFAKGFADALKPSGAALMGGDLVATPGPMAFTLTAMGWVAKGRALTRGGAQPGDVLFVTGTIGDGALGLLAHQGRLGGDDWPHLKARYARPEPRNAFAAQLAERAQAHACIDISDGLVADVGHLCEVSNLCATIEADAVPLSDEARRAISMQPELLDAVMGGGDDYELAFAAPPDAIAAIEELAVACGITVSRIGTFDAGNPGEIQVLDANGDALELAQRGYVHR